MPFLYGNHVLKAHLGRITEDTPEHQGVVVFNMNDVPLVLSCFFSFRIHTSRFRPQGFGVTARSTVDTRKLDPTAIIVFHQACVSVCSVVLVILAHTLPTRDMGEYLRDEVIIMCFSLIQILIPFLGNTLLIHLYIHTRWSSAIRVMGDYNGPNHVECSRPGVVYA